MVGGGPGGATAARLAAEGSKANVLLLEAAKEGRYKCCAGGIPVSNEEFGPIPRGIGEREITGGVIVTPTAGPVSFEATGPRDKGYCVFRTDFDKFLVDQARNAGAQVEDGCRVNNIEVKKSPSTGDTPGEVEVTVQGPAKEYRARCVILATGLGEAHLQRRLGLEVPPMVTAIQAELAIPEAGINESFGNRVWEFFDRALLPHGLGWVFPKARAVSVGVLGEGAKRHVFDAFLQYPNLKEKIAGKEMLAFEGRKVWAAPIPDRMIPKPFCDGVMVVGDACGVADSIVYEGIYQARKSGKLAAEVFCQALTKGDFTERVLGQYHADLLKHLYAEDLRYTYKIHHLLFHSGQLERVIDATMKLAQEDPEMKAATVAIFTGSQTRKLTWETIMTRKWAVMRKLGFWKGLRLIPTLLQAMRM